MLVWAGNTLRLPTTAWVRLFRRAAEVNTYEPAYTTDRVLQSEVAIPSPPVADARYFLECWSAQTGGKVVITELQILSLGADMPAKAALDALDAALANRDGKKVVQIEAHRVELDDMEQVLRLRSHLVARYQAEIDEISSGILTHAGSGGFTRAYA